MIHDAGDNLCEDRGGARAGFSPTAPRVSPDHVVIFPVVIRTVVHVLIPGISPWKILHGGRWGMTQLASGVEQLANLFHSFAIDAQVRVARA